MRRTLLLLALPAAAFAQEPPQTVSTMVVHALPWQASVEATGTVRAVRGADLAAEVSGIVDWLGFDSGRDVPAGAVLLRLRPNDDAAKLAELSANASLAAANQSRDQKQFRAQAVSQATIDADDSALRAARARVEQQKALMEEKIVRAPFAGRLGLRQVDLGQYLPAGTPIVTLQALDPIYVDFYVPQQSLADIRPGQTVAIASDAQPGHSFQGKVTAISPKVDVSTRMAQVRAEIANPDHALLPGMFAIVHATVGQPVMRLTVPNAAIVYAAYGNSVFVLDPGPAHTVRQQAVQLGPTRGDQVAIAAGLHEGDVIVTAGQVKLRPGSVVTVDNRVQPPNSPQPNPREE